MPGDPQPQWTIHSHDLGPECYLFNTRHQQKDPPLGHSEQVMLVIPVDTVKPQTQETAALCKQLQDMIATARSDIHNAETGELEELITKYKDVFVMKSSDYRLTDKVYPCIDAREA